MHVRSHLRLNGYADWLTLHHGWPEAPPAVLELGTEFRQRLRFQRYEGEVRWTVCDLEPDAQLRWVGRGPAGTAGHATYAISPAGSGSRLDFEVNLTGPMLVGPFGALVGRGLRRELGRSAERLAALIASDSPRWLDARPAAGSAIAPARRAGANRGTSRSRGGERSG